MPLYAYKCAEGHEFEQIGKIDGSDQPTRCPIFTDREDPSRRCNASVHKIMTAPARSFPGADSWRR